MILDFYFDCYFFLFGFVILYTWLHFGLFGICHTISGKLSCSTLDME